LLALSLTGKSDPYKQRFGPYAGEVYFSPYPYEFQGWTSQRALEALKEVFATEAAAQSVAAIIIEPVLGEGGFVPAPIPFLVALRRIADEHGIVLICDEIQTGFCRTGKMFAIEHAAIEPDIITVAKSIAGGLPLAGVIGKAAVMDCVRSGGLGGTFGGNPLACAAALATLDIIEDERLAERANHIGGIIEQAMRAMQRRHRAIADVRGIGAMMAMEIADGNDAPRSAAAARIIEEARNRGVLLMPAGARSNVIRILVPLVITDEELREALDRLADSCSAALG
jgi:4-aminobutyrate aminotransferase/(S)-3-amino-2-methylpropionate transaminase